jgi:hypothetical protein
MTDILERLRSDLHVEMEDEQAFEALDKYKQELYEAADEIERLRNTLRKALVVTDFDWAKQLIRQGLNKPEKLL